MSTFTQYRVEAQLAIFTPTTAPNLEMPLLYYNGVNLMNDQSSSALRSTDAGVLGSITYTLTSPYAGLVYGTLDSQTVSSAYVYFDGNATNISTSSPQALTLKTGFLATGLGSITSGSGGTISGVGACTLSSFNNGATGATATVTFTTSGSWTGATFSVTSTGYGATSAPTSATLASGTATCSGTPTLVTVLGGAQGSALRLISLSARQQ